MTSGGLSRTTMTNGGGQDETKTRMGSTRSNSMLRLKLKNI